MQCPFNLLLGAGENPPFLCTLEVLLSCFLHDSGCVYRILCILEVILSCFLHDSLCFYHVFERWWMFFIMFSAR
jgi:hypothetical protein